MPSTIGRSVHRFVLLLAALLAGSAQALECGKFDFPFCGNAIDKPTQYGGGFSPGTGFGGFGGGDCKGRITHTPVVFVHGNGDSAIGWDSPAPARAGKAAGSSVYGELKAHGYNDCELFGVTYLNRSEQQLDNTGKNFHQPQKFRIVWDFIRAVMAYTGSSQVDIVGHSLGVSMSLATLDYHSGNGQNAWGSVRRFVNIAGGLRGLNSCVLGILAADTCQAEQVDSKNAFYEFGFFPDGALPWLPNRWTAAAGEHSMRLAPSRHAAVAFYTIDAGAHDDIHCPRALALWPWANDCERGPLFGAAANVRAQLDIGADPTSPAPPWAAAVRSNVATLFPHDLGGIGHFGARDYAGPLIRRMLTSDCRDAACAGSYEGSAKPAQP